MPLINCPNIEWSAKGRRRKCEFFFVPILCLTVAVLIWYQYRYSGQIQLTDLPEYVAFNDALESVYNDTAYSIEHKIQSAENPLFVRTVAVQRLYDYLRTATKLQHAELYAADPEYQHIECVTTFSGDDMDRLPGYTEAVSQLMNDHGKGRQLLYHQDLATSFMKMVKVDESIQKGLPVWPDQNGVIAVKDIADKTCIGHYYGDEYLFEEFSAQYPLEDLRDVHDHPFRRKWDYAMAQNYDYMDYANLSLPPKVIVSIDGYHDYDYNQFPNGQTLTMEQSQQKMVLEGLLNDARSGLYQSEMTAEDHDRLNCEFVYCAVDGVLQTFLLTHKAVKAGEQLFIYYGPNYSGAE